MDIHRLEIFCRVVELKNFTKAAEELLLSQPTVSEHIKYLEEFVGEQLLDRSGREIVPTPVGRILYRHAKRIIKAREQIIQEINYFRGVISGTISIGASNIPGTYILPPIMASFKRKFPHVKIVVKIGGSREVVKMVLKGEVDIGFTGARWDEKRLDWYDLCQDKLVLAAGEKSDLCKGSEMDLNDIVKLPFLIREKGSGTRAVTEMVLRRYGLSVSRLNIVAELGSNEAVKQAIKAGMGVSFISRFAIINDVENNLIRISQVRGIDFCRSFYIVKLKRRKLTPVASEFMEWSLKEVERVYG